MSEPMANSNAAPIDEPLKSRTPPRTVSVEEAGDILGIGRMAAYHAVWRGQIPSIRIGRRLLVPLAKLNELVPPVDDDEAQPNEGEAA